MQPDELRSIPLFANLKDEQRAAVAARLEEKTVDLGEVIARQGEFAYHYFVIREGLAAVTVEGELVSVLEPSSSFGEIGVLERGRRTASVVAITPMRLLTLTVWDFNAIAEEIPELSGHARALAEERLQRT